MRGHVYQRSKGSWTIMYDLPPDGTGKRKQKTETFRGITKAEAEKVLRERLAAQDNGSYVPNRKETVAQFLERWLETYAATNTTLRTQWGYRGCVNRYVKPSIGNIELQKLTPSHIQRLYAGMLDKGLSSTTVLQLHRILHKALGTAMKWGLLARNPSDAVTPPRMDRKQLPMWDEATIDRFLEISAGRRFGGFYQLAILTGMRRSEICGLKWENVDLAAGRLSVVSTLQRIKGHGLVDSLPKTARSRRSIALAPQAVNLLHAIRGQQIEQQLAAGELWQNTGYVFTEPDGSPIIPDKVTQDFAKLVTKAGLPHLTLHGLRHAHATLLLTAGVHPKVVSERLGHSNIAITMDTYSHVLPGLQEEAALILEDKLFTQRRAPTE